MIFLHIVDDYYLQGILANMKQRCWWKQNAPDPLYKYDWIIALIMHGVSWSFSIMFPIALYNNFQIGWDFALLFVMNATIHAFIDNLKANKLKINLIADQTAHIIQICLTALYFLT
ncbi:MAG: DUF3307 domain-containing protein [Lachnospiraceae bacterium]|nr:DUF3307 domain-containing protein [Ruminococcus sp.]MCM1276772.1 DUF3307 domain-containing protein [Lachnospiraceae bacterium]